VTRRSDAGAVEVHGHLDRPTVDAVHRLVDAATEADGVRPLSEHVMLHLRYGGEPPARHLLLRAPDHQLAGYAHVDVTDVVEGPSAELVVAPEHRGRGYGHALLEAAQRQSPDGRLRLWAHGQHSGAAGLARSLGLEQMRSLWQMRRSLYAALPDATVPEGVVVRTFEPGRDDHAWLELNARAFAAHPEQGGWTIDDLHRRMREPWFDPAGFFLAEQSGQLVGFHWTKVHGGAPAAPPDASLPHLHDGPTGHGHEPIGEIYVLGVDPKAHGIGLGRALSVVGLRHLRSLGLPEVMLYVEADNAAAIALYTGLGFTHWDTDVLFRRP
jgi:mycothiol synthase